MNIQKKAAVVLMAALSSVAFAHTDNYQDFYRTSGCRLMLCLQNPNGPMAVQECQQDVQAFFTELALAYYGHNVSIPICTPSMKNGTFFTIGKVYEFVPVSKDGTVTGYRWDQKNQFAISTYIGNKSWRNWAFSGKVNPDSMQVENMQVGLLDTMSQESSRFLSVQPWGAKGVPSGGPYASAMPKGMSLTTYFPNEKLLAAVKNKNINNNGIGYGRNRFGNSKQNAETVRYVNAWKSATGYKEGVK